MRDPCCRICNMFMICLWWVASSLGLTLLLIKNCCDSLYLWVISSRLIACLNPHANLTRGPRVREALEVEYRALQCTAERAVIPEPGRLGSDIIRRRRLFSGGSSVEAAQGQGGSAQPHYSAAGSVRRFRKTEPWLDPVRRSLSQRQLADEEERRGDDGPASAASWRRSTSRRLCWSWQLTIAEEARSQLKAGQRVSSAAQVKAAGGGETQQAMANYRGRWLEGEWRLIVRLWRQRRSRVEAPGAAGYYCNGGEVATATSTRSQHDSAKETARGRSCGQAVTQRVEANAGRTLARLKQRLGAAQRPDEGEAAAAQHR
ncbi:hypothetical protein TRIUR3_33671 [Triticum urartu]|uniref:Uncharacterized protein n=1 Tax=Triticum urartu TaxID=4572 RepID=M7YDI1_TRIUA|nr:hypothetical protein TRIUR3_33671 [Triticum urartu]